MPDDTQDFLVQMGQEPEEGSLTCAFITNCDYDNPCGKPAAWLRIRHLGQLKNYRSVVLACDSCRVADPVVAEAEDRWVPVAEADRKDLNQALSENRVRRI